MDTLDPAHLEKATIVTSGSAPYVAGGQTPEGHSSAECVVATPRGDVVATLLRAADGWLTLVVATDDEPKVRAAQAMAWGM